MWVERRWGSWVLKREVDCRRVAGEKEGSCRCCRRSAGFGLSIGMGFAVGRAGSREIGIEVVEPAERESNCCWRRERRRSWSIRP